MITIISIIAFILIADLIWLNLYSSNYKMLVKKVQGSDMKINRLGAILSYLCVLIAIFCFAIPLIEKTKKTDFLTCLKYGGGIGFVIYGVFNATNLAIFKNYDPVVALVDTTWGVTLFTLSCYIYFIIKKTKTIS